MTLKSITLRLEPELYDKIKSLASREKSSFNNFVASLIIEKLKENEKKELFDDFSLVGEDSCSNVEYAINAQKEVILFL